MDKYNKELLNEKLHQLVDSRKFFEHDALAEYALVDRNLLSDIFDLLLEDGTVIAGFQTEDRHLMGEDVN